MISIKHIYHHLTWIVTALLLALMIAQQNIVTIRGINTFEYILNYHLTLGLCAGVVMSAVAQRIYKNEYWLYLLGILIRYYAGFYMLSIGYSKIDDTFFDITIDTYNKVLIDLEAKDIAWVFFDHSYGYQAFIGLFQIIGATLLFFRRTALLGSIISTTILINAILINYYFDLDRTIWTYSMTALCAYPIYLQLPRLARFFLANEVISKESYPFFNNQKLYNSSIILKLVLIAGPIVMYTWNMERVSNWTRKHYDHPAVGAWIIDNIEYKTDSLKTKEIPKFERMLFNKGRRGQLITNDTTSGFEYIVDTAYDQFEMYNFYEFRNMDVKGKYIMQSPDTLLFTGTNQKDSLNFTMIRDKRFEKILKPK